MTKLPAWILSDGKELALKELDELLGPIGELAKKWKSIAEQLSELEQEAPTDEPRKLIRYVLENIGKEPVSTVLTKVDAGLAEKLAGLSSDFLDSKWAKLIDPVGDLHEDFALAGDANANTWDDGTNKGLILIPLPELDKSQDVSVKNLDTTFGIAGSSDIQVEAGSVWPFRSDLEDERFVRIGASGKIEGKAGAKLPFQPWGALGAEVSADGMTRFGFFYRTQETAEGKQLFVEAVPGALASLANPFSLQALATDAAVRGFGGFAMFLEGGVEGMATVTLGKDFAFKDAASLKLDLTASVKFARMTSWVLSLRPIADKHGNRIYKVVLSRRRGESEKWSAGGNIVADISGLAQKLDKALTEALEKAEPLVEQIKPFLSPGSYAIEKLGGLLKDTVGELAGDEALAKAITTDLGLLLGTNTDNKSAVEGWLKEKLTAAIDDVSGGVLNDPDTFVSGVLDKLTAHLPGFLPAQLTQQGRSKVDTLVKAILEDYEAKKKELTEDSNVAEKLVKQLAKVGVTVQEQADKADEALAGIRKLVEGYEKLAAKLQEEVKKAANHQIGLKFAASFEKWKKRHYELIGEISDVNEDTKSLWRQLMLGRLQPVQQILMDGRDDIPGFTILPGSRLVASAGSKRTFSVKLEFAGIDLSYEAIAEGTADVEYDAVTGDVKVKAVAKAKKHSSFFGTTRTSNFVSATDIQDFKAGETKRGITMAVDLSRSDRNFEREELTEFLKGLIDNNLITKDRYNKAVNALSEAIKNANGSKVPGKIGFATNLNQRQIGNLLGIGLSAAENTPVHKQLYLSTFETLVECRLGGKSRVKRAIKDADRMSNGRGLELIYQERHDLTEIAAPDDRAGTRNRHALSAIDRHNELSQELPELFHAMRTVYSSMPEKRGQDGWDEDRYRKEQQEIADNAKGWINLRTGRAGDSGLHPTMLALLRFLARLDADFGLVDANGKLVQSEAGALAAVKALAKMPDASTASSLLKLHMKLGTEDELEI